MNRFPLLGFALMVFSFLATAQDSPDPSPLSRFKSDLSAMPVCGGAKYYLGYRPDNDGGGMVAFYEERGNTVGDYGCFRVSVASEGGSIVLTPLEWIRKHPTATKLPILVNNVNGKLVASMKGGNTCSDFSFRPANNSFLVKEFCE